MTYKFAFLTSSNLHVNFNEYKYETQIHLPFSNSCRTIFSRFFMFLFEKLQVSVVLSMFMPTKMC